MKLYDYTMSQIMESYVKETTEEKGISKAQAKKLFLNALLSNVVVEAVGEQIDYLIENQEE